MKNKIYFDMDGVLADFEGYLRSQNISYAPQENRKQGQDEQMWDQIKNIPHFYLQLPPVPGSIELFQDLSKKYDCEILSAIPKPKWGLEHTKEDKIDWVHKYLGENVKTNIVYREEKKNYCLGPKSVLIDDLAKNIREWEAAGGTGILFVDADKTRSALKLPEKQSPTPMYDKLKSLADKEPAEINKQMEDEIYVTT